MSDSTKPTAVNGAIIDAITVTNTKVLAEAPAMAMGSLYQTIGNSVAMAAANAIYAQQQANVTYQAATTLGVTKLFSADTSSAATSINHPVKPNADPQEQIQSNQQQSDSNGNNQ